MSAVTEEKVNAVEPERLHQALGIYQSALIAGEPGDSVDGSAAGDETASLRAMQAVKLEFPDPKEFLSLSLRLKRFTEVVSDKKLIKWGMVKHSEGGLEIHDAVVLGCVLSVGIRNPIAFVRVAIAAITRIGHALEVAPPGQTRQVKL